VRLLPSAFNSSNRRAGLAISSKNWNSNFNQLINQVHPCRFKIWNMSHCCLAVTMNAQHGRSPAIFWGGLNYFCFLLEMIVVNPICGGVENIKELEVFQHHTLLSTQNHCESLKMILDRSYRNRKNHKIWRPYEHQILFLLPSRLLYFLVRGGTCPHCPYRLIAYDAQYFESWKDFK